MRTVMLIYMDLCCFNRPFDDQTSKTIFLETEAKLFIQDMIHQGSIELAWSYMLEYENSANPDIDVRASIAHWRTESKKNIPADKTIVDIAQELHNQGFGVKDSLHISCAMAAGADYFITTDLKILRKRSGVSRIMIVNPVEFISLKETQT